MSTPRPRRTVVAAPPRKPPAELRGIRVIVEADPDPDVAFLDEPEFEDQRAAYERGELTFVGVQLEADVHIQDTDQVLTSPGLWGVESDALESVITEEWQALRNVLKAVGVPTSELPTEADEDWPIERRSE